jgi:hypothetical protein
MPYTLTFNSLGTLTGVSIYDILPDTLQENEYECTADQFVNPSILQLVDGVITMSNSAALLDAQTVKAAELDVACANEIVSGFSSSALGSLHTYPSAMTDQQNLTASVVASMLPGITENWTIPFWCEDQTGTWDYIPHNATQIQQAGIDGKNAILTAMAKKKALVAQVLASETVDAVNSIAWS